MAHEDTEVTVIGGGLAGMVAALRLLQNGKSVSLYDVSPRLGGKAGSEIAGLATAYDNTLGPIAWPANFISDHGYHIFPVWYKNMRGLWNDIGLVEGTHSWESPEDFLSLQRMIGGDYTPYDAPFNLIKALQQFFSLCALVTSSDNSLDDLTLRGFLASRFYNDKDSVTFDTLLLNALAIRDFDVSSRSVRHLFWQWIPNILQHKAWIALKGPLQTVLIDRLENAIVAAGNAGPGYFSYTNHELTGVTLHNNRAEYMMLDKTSGTSTPLKGDRPVVLAIPQENLRALVSDDIRRLEPAFGDLQYLRSLTYSGLDVVLNNRVDPAKLKSRYYFFYDQIHDNPFGLSMFNASELWEGELPGFDLRGRTLLQFVVGDPRRFNNSEPEYFLEKVSQYLADFIPDIPNNVEFYVPHQNVDVPLVVNDVGTSDKRPKVTTAINNMFIAGDFVENITQITSMEGAVRSGNMVAEEVLSSGGINVVLQEPAVEFPDWLWWLAWFCRWIPLYVLIGLIIWICVTIF